MRIIVNNYNEEEFIPKFLMGGEMPVEGEEVPGEVPEEAPVDQQPVGDPMEELLSAAAQALQNNDCEIALTVCLVLLQMAQGGAGGEQPMPEEQPVYRAGGKLSRTIRKNF